MFAIALNDLRLTLSDRAALMWLFVLPIVMAVFFGVVMGGGGGDPSKADAVLTLVDEDGGIVAEEFISNLEGEGLELRRVTRDELPAVEHPFRTLVLPPGFSEDVSAGTRVMLRLETEPGTSDEAALLAEARIVRAITRTIGRIIAASSDLEDGEPVSIEAFGGAEPGEDLVRVEATFAGRSRTIPSGFAQSVPGNAVMFVMLVALTYGAASLTSERQSGLLRRMATTPVGPERIILGKILGRLAVSGVQVTLFVLVALAGRAFFGIELGNLFDFWVVLLIYTLCVAPLGVAFGAWFEDAQRASSIGVIVTMVLASMGGCWWPLEIVPATFQKIALVFPTTWAMRALHGVVSFGSSLAELALPLGVLVIFGVVFTVLAVRSLRVV